MYLIKKSIISRPKIMNITIFVLTRHPGLLFQLHGCSLTILWRSKKFLSQQGVLVCQNVSLLKCLVPLPAFLMSSSHPFTLLTGIKLVCNFLEVPLKVVIWRETVFFISIRSDTIGCSLDLKSVCVMYLHLRIHPDAIKVFSTNQTCGKNESMS